MSETQNKEGQEAALDWEAAKRHLDTAIQAAREIGPAGFFVLCFSLDYLRRFERGERTKWLHEDIMGIEL